MEFWGISMQFTDEERKYVLKKAKGFSIEQVKVLCNPYFNIEQMEEIYLGFKAGIEVSKYANMKYAATQMRKIRKGLEKGYDISTYIDASYSEAQIQEISKGMEARVDISIFARYYYTDTQMREIRLALEEGMMFNPEPSWTVEYIQERRSQYETQLRDCTVKQKREIVLGSKQGICMIRYKGYPAKQMREIRKGLKVGINVLDDIKGKHTVKKMRKIRKKITRQRKKFKDLLNQISD